MSVPVLIIGRSGSGKTYSLKKFSKDEVGVISVEKGRLPFKSDIKAVKVPKDPTGGQAKDAAQLNAAKYAWIMNAINKAKTKSIVIDDSQYLMVNELFDRTYEKGYDKFTSMAQKFFLHHSELDTDGREKVKTIGKMLDEKLTVEGCFDIVIYCQDHKFFTQSNGQSTAKTPEDMLPLEMPNDLKAVDEAIRNYYNIGEDK